MRTDWLFRTPSLELARAHAATGGPTWLYELTREVPRPGLGAPHSSDAPLLFGTLGSAAARFAYLEHPPSAAEALGSQMRAEWTRFAHDGDPGWAAYDRAEEATRVYGQDVVTRAYPEQASSRAWRGHPVVPLSLGGGA